MPFFLSRIYSFYCVKTPEQVFNNIFFGFLLNQMVAGIWVLVALTKFYEFKSCEFTIGYFNYFFYTLYMMHALISWVIAPFFCVYLYKMTSQDVESMNQKIRTIATLPSQPYDERIFTAQKSCAICINDFVGDSDCPSIVSWLSCDVRHYFHTDCVKFWLHRQSQCPLCKLEVNYDQVKRKVD